MSSNIYLQSLVNVKIAGADAPLEFMRDLLETTVESSLHLPAVATLVLYDDRLYWIDEASLLPGKSLQVWIEADGQKKLLFDGEIVELEPSFEATIQRFTVRAFDRLHRLARGRHARSFLNVSDQDLLQTIASEVGLQAKVVSQGFGSGLSQVYPYVFQNNETDLEFLRRRASKLGYLLYVQGSTLYFAQPPAQGQAQGATVALEWGKSMYEFHPCLTTVGQTNDIMVRGWDPEQKQAIIGKQSSPQTAPQLKKNGGTFSQSAFNVDAQMLHANQPVRVQTTANQMAQALGNQQAGQFVEADGACNGDAELIAGVSVNISAVGDRFSGTYFVTSATHSYNNHGYMTQFHIADYHPGTLLHLLQRDEDLAPPMSLVIGLVTDNNDPTGGGRVKVKYPWLTDEHASDWARVVTPGGGSQRGLQFLPEVNDEVLVGFEMGDIHYPYVLGGLWNGQDAPPKKAVIAPDGTVQQRIICSRTGHIITLDDSDDSSGITIQDKNGNKVAFDSQQNKLTISVQGDINLQADGNLSLKANGNMSLQATANLDLEAKGELQVKGTTVGVNGQAEVTVKGGIINLN